ncbi:MAG: glycosyltransferase family 2 protein [Gammaproteobacteria bacterium]
MSLVSIIMPCYNSENYLDTAISSVVEQSYSNWQLIICDDGSTDNSLNIAREYEANDSRIYVTTNRYEKGASGARNTCLDVAEGRYIAFLDADDQWLPSKLSLQMDFMIRNGYSFIYSYYEVMSEDGRFVSDCMAPASVNSSLMKLYNFIPCLTAVYDSHVIGKQYQPVISKRNDYALWLKILNCNKVDRAYCLPFNTARYRANSYGLSSNKSEALKYHSRCLVEYGNCNLFEKYFYSAICVLIVVIKKKLNFIYNYFVQKM